MTKSTDVGLPDRGEDAKVKAYFDGYKRVPDDDEDFRGVADYSIKHLRRTSET